MEVYAFIGSSGTGKSHHANDIARQYDIEYIIDDGLLIHHGKKKAGISAKAQPSMVAAVKSAIFLDPDRAEEMRLALQQEAPEKLLILGTSEHMIDRIVHTLGLPALKQIIFIQDVVSAEEIELARQMRLDGKHVIPLPAIEVKKDFPNVWIDPLVSLFRRKNVKNKRNQDEKSILRPDFSKLGQVTIAENVVTSLVQFIAKKNRRIGGGCKVQVTMTDLGVLIQCETKVCLGTPIQMEMESFQNNVIEEVEFLTGLTVRSIDVRVSGVYPKEGILCSDNL